MGVVEAFDVVEYSCAGLVLGGEAGAVQEFGLEGGEEQLGDGRRRRRRLFVPLTLRCRPVTAGPKRS